MPLNEELRQRLTTRAAEIHKSVNDCVSEAVEQWLEVTEDDPRAGAKTVAPEATAPGLGPRLASIQPPRFPPGRLSCFRILNYYQKQDEPFVFWAARSPGWRLSGQKRPVVASSAA